MNKLLLYQMKLGHDFNSVPSANFLRAQFWKYHNQRIEFEVRSTSNLPKYCNVQRTSEPVYINAVFVSIIKAPEIRLLLRKVVFKCGKQKISRVFHEMIFPTSDIVMFHKWQNG